MEERERRPRRRKQKKTIDWKKIGLIAGIVLLFLVLILLFLNRSTIDSLQKPENVEVYGWKRDMLVYGEGNTIRAVNLEGERLWSVSAAGVIEKIIPGKKYWGVITDGQILLLNQKGETINLLPYPIKATDGKMIGNTFYVWGLNTITIFTKDDYKVYGAQEMITDVIESNGSVWATDASVQTNMISSNLYQLIGDRLTLVYPELTDVMMRVFDAGVPLALTPHTGVFYDEEPRTIQLPDYNDVTYKDALYLLGNNITKVTEEGNTDVISTPRPLSKIVALQEGVIAYDGSEFFYAGEEKIHGKIPQKITSIQQDGKRILVDVGDVWIQCTLDDLLKAKVETEN